MQTMCREVIPHMRWMIRRDLPEVVAIDRHCFGDQRWDEERFCDNLKDPDRG